MPLPNKVEDIKNIAVPTTKKPLQHVRNNIKSMNEHYGLENEDISHPTN